MTNPAQPYVATLTAPAPTTPTPPPPPTNANIITPTTPTLQLAQLLLENLVYVAIVTNQDIILVIKVGRLLGRLLGALLALLLGLLC